MTSFIRLLLTGLISLNIISVKAQVFEYYKMTSKIPRITDKICLRTEKGACYLENKEIVFDKNYTHLEELHFIEDYLSNREYRKANKNGGSISNKYGVANGKLKEILSPDYISIRAISSSTFWVYTLDKEEYLIDIETGKKIVSPYKAIIQWGVPNITFGVKNLEELDRKEYVGDIVVLRADLSESVIIPNVNLSEPIELAYNQIILINSYQDSIEEKATFLYSLTGELIDIKRQVENFIPGIQQGPYRSDVKYWLEQVEKGKTQKVYAEQIGKSPISLFNNTILYHPLDKNGAAMELPENVIGAMPVIATHFKRRINGYYKELGTNYFVNGWVLVSKTPNGYRYRIGEGTPQEVVSKYDSLEELESIRTAYLKYSFYKHDFLNYNHYLNNWVWDDFDKVLITKVADKNEYKVIKSVYHPQVDKASAVDGKSYSGAVITITQEREDIYAEEKKKQRHRLLKREELTQQHLENIRQQFESNFGKTDANSVSNLHDWALTLGAEYFKRFIMKYYPFDYSDVQYACKIDPNACQWANNYWNDLKAREQAKADAYYRLKEKYTPSNDVKVLIIEGGQMRQEVYSREHYNKYYKP